MRLGAYLRVSGAAQIDAWGLDRQESAVKQWSRFNKHRIVEWYRDEGVSGTLEAVDRPELSRAIRDIGTTIDGILVADLDRFARSLTVQETALALCWRAGGVVFTATAGEVHADDPDDPSRTLIRQVMGAVIEYEKRQGWRRMRQGMLAKAAAGRHAVGQYAFGYRGTGKGKQRDAGPDENEQRAVRRILELRADGCSYREIAATLDAEELRPRKAERWSAMAVRNITLRESGRVAR
jgi:DNA invertase Pin-like site-specific DNA recombinase